MNKNNINHAILNSSLSIKHMLCNLEKANKEQNINKQIIHLKEIEKRARITREALEHENNS